MELKTAEPGLDHRGQAHSTQQAISKELIITDPSDLRPTHELDFDWEGLKRELDVFSPAKPGEEESGEMLTRKQKFIAQVTGGRVTLK